MAIPRHRLARFRPGLSFVLLAALLVILWFAGGASRENVAGQIVSRAAAWTAIVITALFGQRPRLEGARGAALFLLAAILLCVVQLVPLPPGLWHTLPGRSAFADPLVSPPGLWRPWSLAPGTTVNALFSLVVPLAVMLLATSAREEQKRWLPATILAVIALSLVVGLIQFTGAQIVNPLVNGIPGAVDGLLANRNHYALFLSFGLLIAPASAFGDGTRSKTSALAALGLIVLLVLTLLATGSRTGLVLGIVALVLGLVLARRGVKTAFRRYPRWVLPALSIGLVALLAISVLASVAADRAVSIDRLVDQNAGQDMRGLGRPVVLAIIQTYFPFGTGIGSFDPIFRMHEPLALLQPTYFNHAHNDFLEIVLDAGLPGLLLLLTALSWWGWKSMAAWRGEEAQVLPRLGSAMLLLILLASITDYPARTPIIMAMTMIAAIWLGEAGRGQGACGKVPLPPTRRHL
jgi:O-antigen ligase